MQTIFVAHGPAFKHGYHAKPFNSVDYYPMMCHILGISPAPNNGSLGNIMPMFVTSFRTPFEVLIPGLLAVCAWLLYVVIQCRITRGNVRPHVETQRSEKKGL